MNYEAIFKSEKSEEQEPIDIEGGVVRSIGSEQFIIQDHRDILENTFFIVNVEKRNIYTVQVIEEDAYSCSCRDHYHRVHNGNKSECKHQKAVNMVL